jgi:transposase
MFYEVKAIARAKIKTDKRDSEVPAHLLRMNMIPEVYRRSTENRQAQQVLRQRAFYVSAMFDLRCFYERPARGKGANKAKVATAKRLLTIIYKVCKEGRNYIAYRR